MRKLLVITALLLCAGVTFGQTLQKGGLLGIHHATITLNPGVTLDQYIDFGHEKIVPAVEKQFPGVKFFMLKGDRGENKNELGILWYFNSVKDRDIYFTSEGDLTEKGLAAQIKLLPIMEEWGKLGTYTTTHTDWIIQ